jgi:predicted nucleic acid-binding protein
VILPDTSIWIDHFRSGNEVLRKQLEAGLMLIHPFVFGEIALGSWRQRTVILESLAKMPRAIMAESHEVFEMIERHRLFGRGIGYVDVHLLASVGLMTDAWLWTRDMRLLAVARELGLDADPNFFPSPQ